MSSVNKVLVTGSSGYVGNYILKTMAKAHPSI
jgi:nucleoside-diphosphate-sugar epimerase